MSPAIPHAGEKSKMTKIKYVSIIIIFIPLLAFGQGSDQRRNAVKICNYIHENYMEKVPKDILTDDVSATLIYKESLDPGKGGDQEVRSYFVSPYKNSIVVFRKTEASFLSYPSFDGYYYIVSPEFFPLSLRSSKSLNATFDLQIPESGDIEIQCEEFAELQIFTSKGKISKIIINPTSIE
jgi:hypothetical protein